MGVTGRMSLCGPCATSDVERIALCFVVVLLVRRANFRIPRELKKDGNLRFQKVAWVCFVVFIWTIVHFCMCWIRLYMRRLFLLLCTERPGRRNITIALHRGKI